MPKKFSSYDWTDAWGNNSYRYDTHGGNLTVLLHEYDEYWWVKIINNRGSNDFTDTPKLNLPGHTAMELVEIIQAIKRRTKNKPYKNPSTGEIEKF